MSAPLAESPPSSSPRRPAASLERRAAARPKFQPRERRSPARLAAGVLVVLVVCVVVAMKLRPARVTVTPVVRGTAIDAVYATGTIEPFDRVVVKARASGTLDLKVREGARVRKGDLLAQIDSPVLASDLARGRAELWAASHQAGAKGPQTAALRAQARALEAELNTVKTDQARVRKLVASGSTAQAELDRLVDRAAALDAQLSANTAQQDALGIDLTARARGSSAEVDSLAARLADTEVRAPIDGTVLSRFVEPGEVAMVNSPLFKLGAVENLVLECAIDETDIGRVALGKKVAVSLYAFPQATYKGEVFEILPDADREKKAFVTKVRLLDPPEGLRSGMTAEVNVIIEERSGAMLVPADSVSADGSVHVVAGGRVERRMPSLGVHDMLRVEVLGGLMEGDAVVVAGADGLADGTRVVTVEAPPPAAAHDTSAPRGGMSL